MAQSSTAQRKLVHADIKPNNSPELATRFLDVPNMPWEETKFPGIQIKVLYSDEEGPNHRALQACAGRRRAAA